MSKEDAAATILRVYREYARLSHMTDKSTDIAFSMAVAALLNKIE